MLINIGIIIKIDYFKQQEYYKMGCASSERKDAAQLNREKMLVEYLNGLNRKPVKELNSSAAGAENWYGLIDQYEVGDLITAPDGSQLRILEKGVEKGLVECLNCKMEILRKNMKAHLESSNHIESLF